MVLFCCAGLLPITLCSLRTTATRMETRNVVVEAIYSMDPPRIEFMQRQLTRNGDGVDRIQFVTIMGT